MRIYPQKEPTKDRTMRKENQRMQAFLLHHGIKARVKFLPDGSLRGCWRISDFETRWTPALRERLSSLGFVDHSREPLTEYAGNGGRLSVFVRGHDELLTEDPKLFGNAAAVINETVPTRPEDVPATDEQLEALAPMIALIRQNWAARCAAYMAANGDTGSCVLGAGIGFKYREAGCRSIVRKTLIPAHEVTGAQGSLVWEESVNEFVEVLKAAGLASAFYECGRMD